MSDTRRKKLEKEYVIVKDKYNQKKALNGLKGGNNNGDNDDDYYEKYIDAKIQYQNEVKMLKEYNTLKEKYVQSGGGDPYRMKAINEKIKYLENKAKKSNKSYRNYGPAVSSDIDDSRRFKSKVTLKDLGFNDSEY